VLWIRQRVENQVGRIEQQHVIDRRWRVVSFARGSSIHIPPEWSWDRTELWRSGDLAVWQRSSQPSRPRSTSEPASLLHCQGVRRSSGGAARQGVEQAACRFRAHGKAVVERDDDGHAPGGVHAAGERYRRRITSSIEEPVLANHREAKVAASLR
jgi:hypothetical protein